MGVLTLDVDGVLFDCNPAVVSEINRRLGTSFTINQVITYRIAKSLEVFDERVTEELVSEIFDNLIRVERGSRLLPLEGAADGLRELLEDDDELVFVTSRDEKKWGEATKFACERSFGSVYNDIVFTGVGRSEDFTDGMINGYKSDTLKRLGCKVHVEDGLHFAEEVARSGLSVVLVDQPWNQKRSNYETYGNTGRIRRTSPWRVNRQWDDIPGLVRSFK